MTSSQIDDLSIRQLMAFIFLVEQAKPLDELMKAVLNPEFIAEWNKEENNFRKLIKYYPNEDEERYFLLATLEAVHNVDHYSEEALNLKIQYLPYIKILLKE